MNMITNIAFGSSLHIIDPDTAFSPVVGVNGVPPQLWDFVDIVGGQPGQVAIQNALTYLFVPGVLAPGIGVTCSDDDTFGWLVEHPPGTLENVRVFKRNGLSVTLAGNGNNVVVVLEDTGAGPPPLAAQWAVNQVI